MDAWQPNNLTARNFKLIGQGIIVVAMNIAILAMFVILG